THELIRQHPIPAEKLAGTTTQSWEEIFETKIGRKGLLIGTDIFPQPQIMGFFLHELIPINIATEYPDWRRDVGGTEKDVVYSKDPFYSFEIKTSSNPRNIFGNRSYAQLGQSEKRLKDGYLLAVNFEGFNRSKTPRIVRIRFGWLEHSDWIGQRAATGQQARLSTGANHFKLIDIM
ncbi:MAG: ScaI family restriction endonuclease, partial [Dehalococcoidia bacterium]